MTRRIPTKRGFFSALPVFRRRYMKRLYHKRIRQQNKKIAVEDME